MLISRKRLLFINLNKNKHGYWSNDSHFIKKGCHMHHLELVQWLEVMGNFNWEVRAVRINDHNITKATQFAQEQHRNFCTSAGERNCSLIVVFYISQVHFEICVLSIVWELPYWNICLFSKIEHFNELWSDMVCVILLLNSSVQDMDLELMEQRRKHDDIEETTGGWNEVDIDDNPVDIKVSTALF